MRLRFRRPVGVLLLVAGACGGNVVLDMTTGSAGAGGGVGAGGSAGVGPGAGGGAVGVCVDAGPYAFPASYKACASASDCTVQIAVGCCTQYAQGIAASEVAAYQATEAACYDAGTPCFCPVGAAAVVTDEGQVGDGGMPLVACNGGLCTTYFP